MGFMARWVFSYVPLWGHLILANPDLAAMQGLSKAAPSGCAPWTPARQRDKTIHSIEYFFKFLDRYMGG